MSGARPVLNVGNLVFGMITCALLTDADRIERVVVTNASRFLTRVQETTLAFCSMLVPNRSTD